MRKPVTIYSFTLHCLVLYFVLFGIACQEQAPQQIRPQSLPKNGTIEDLMQNLDKLKQSASADSLYPFQQQVQKQQVLFTKSTEELRAELLAPVQERDRQDFYSELQSIWKVGKHQAFFKRQISYCQNKIDLAVVGMGIIRVDEVLKNQNPSVHSKDHSAFIQFVKEQVQQALASKDKNYKALVFKGLESSSH